MRLYLRQSNSVVFSQSFVDRMKEKGVILTRRNRYTRDGIILNHGNSNPITYSKRVTKLYLLNNPEYIKYCGNKELTYKMLEDYFPDTFLSIDDIDDMPVIIKPIHGHHGYGIKQFYDYGELLKYLDNTDEEYLIQRLIPIKHEYRFNVFNQRVFQVSRREKQIEKTDLDGFIFEYYSLGKEAKIKQKFWNFISDIISKVYSHLGKNLCSYCIDVIKGMDNKYYLSELNSAYGIGGFTIMKLIEEIHRNYEDSNLEDYRIC